MDRNELTLAIAAALTGAALVGWLLHWIFARLARSGGGSLDAAQELAARLHEAEMARDAAERRGSELLLRLGEAERERDAALGALDAARAQADEVRAAYRAAMADRDAPRR